MDKPQLAVHEKSNANDLRLIPHSHMHQDEIRCMQEIITAQEALLIEHQLLYLILL